MSINELCVTYSDLSQPRSSESEALNIYHGSAIHPYIRDIVEDGLSGKSIDHLRDQLDYLMVSADYQLNPAHVLSNIIFTLADCANLRTLVNLCLNHEHLGMIEAGSYIHNNGFKKIVLLQSPLFKVRLHLWDCVPGKLPQESVHDHRWPFASVMLNGKFTSKIYQVAENGTEERFGYQYRPVTDGKYSLQGTGTARLKESVPLILKKSIGYYMPPETLHRVIFECNERTITLVVTGTPINQSCRLFTTTSLDEEATSVERIGKLAIQNMIKELKYI